MAASANHTPGRGSGGALRCSECGKCVSYRDPDVMAYTLYGTQYDTEPPDPVYICGPCWDGLTDEDKALIERVAWMMTKR